MKKEKRILNYPLIVIGFILITTNSCHKDEPTAILPVLTTSSISNVTDIAADCGGNITDDGGGTITERGVCYGTSQNPTTANSKLISIGTTGEFTSSLTELTASTIYYVRAYAMNSVGTAYGNEITFTTFVSSSNLVAYYPFNGNANDESGNSNNGTVYGATITVDRKGNADNAYSFDGISNYISIPNSNSLKPTSVTVSLWVRIPTQSINNYYGIITKRYDEFSEPFNSYAIEITSSSKLSFTISNGAYSGRIETSTDYSYDTWMHVVGTYDSQYAKIYINGVLKNSNYYNKGLGYSSLPMRIGMLCFNPSQNNVFYGKIDDIRIYNCALSETEIQQLYNE